MPTLQFKGKTFVQNHHLAVKYHQLTPRKDLSLTGKVSLHDNLIIHGDNLKALKALLPTYSGKVKCIYIDPPYNTGNEKWVYNDNVNSPMINEWLGQEVNVDDLTRHDKWLCMMMPRLKLLRELLDIDGVLFISIDDNEVHRLRILLDEIFGEKNFIAQLAILNNPKGRVLDKYFSTNHEYCLVYSNMLLEKDSLTLKKSGEQLIKDFPHEEGDERFRISELRNTHRDFGKHNRASLYYPIFIDPKNPQTVSLTEKKAYIKILPNWDDGFEGCWTWGKELTEREGKRLFGKKIGDKWKVYKKTYSGTGEMKMKSLWSDRKYHTEVGQDTFNQIFKEGKSLFSSPKPVDFIKDLINLATDEDSIILDSFAGSGTTGQAVLELNKEDGGNRQFILVETENYADDITAERVRRVIKGAKTSKNENLKKGLGGTFSYFDLGKEIEMESILRGKNLPDYKDFARYLYFTATGEEAPTSIKEDKKTVIPQLIGESKNYEVYLFYKSDLEWLKNNALTLELCKALPKFNKKQRLVFAPSKYVDDRSLREMRIDFCQLPYEIYRMK